MYLKSICLENVGPIESCNLELPFNSDGNPTPIVLVGENGTGKSIIISYIVNALIHAKQLVFTDSEVEEHKVYKLRSPNYIRSEESYYFAEMVFENDLTCLEWQLRQTRKDFESNLGYTPNNPKWTKIPETETSLIWSNFNAKKVQIRELLNSNCILYFPPNRFEEPAWLNYENLKARAQYTDIKHLQGYSNRTIIQYSSLKANQNWLLDILFDRHAFEAEAKIVPNQAASTGPRASVILDYSGECAQTYKAILTLLRAIMKVEDPIRFGIGNRKMRTISVMRNDKEWIPNIFQLSTGESLLLNLFLCIIRDFDLARVPFQGLEEIRGIVLVDEVDSHLHSCFQCELLPTLLKYFPKVQFIVTSHSPLFLFGMQREYGDDGFMALETPNCKPISVDIFSEFQQAYEYFKQSNAFESDIKVAIRESRQPIVFVEGDYDVRYLSRAAELLSRQKTLSKITLKDGEGYGTLNNIWKHFNTPICEVVPQPIILLYDCDTSKSNAEKGNVFKRVVPSRSDSPINKGMENLFPPKTIDKAQKQCPQFVDVTPEVKKLVRGKEELVPEFKEINEDEKGNFCTWICKNGTADDFANFQSVFDLIEEVLSEVTE